MSLLSLLCVRLDTPRMLSFDCLFACGLLFCVFRTEVRSHFLSTLGRDHGAHPQSVVLLQSNLESGHAILPNALLMPYTEQCSHLLIVNFFPSTHRPKCATMIVRPITLPSTAQSASTPPPRSEQPNISKKHDNRRKEPQPHLPPHARLLRHTQHAVHSPLEP